MTLRKNSDPKELIKDTLDAHRKQLDQIHSKDLAIPDHMTALSGLQGYFVISS